METVLGASQELARLTMQVERMFAFEWDPSTNEVWCSNDCKDILGFTQRAGNQSPERIHPDDQESLIRTVRDLTPANDSYEIEYRVIQPSLQKTFRQNGRAFFAPTGEMTRLPGTIADVTDRKQTEAILRESELLYKDVFNNFSECVFVLDVTMDGRFKIAALNPAEEKATGLSTREVAGKYIEDVFPEDLAKRLTAHYRQCLETGTLINYNEELNLPIGTRYFHTNLIPVRNADGRIHRIVGCCMDFTNLKRAQEEAAARQKLESLGALAGGVAHDFNNLLGAILASTELALTEREDDSVVEEELERIRTATIRGSEIVRQLMIYGGKDNPSFEPVDVSVLVEEMLRLLKVSISKHAVLQTELGKDLPPLHANPGQIRQVVMNLVSNASEAIGELDGVIRISTRLETTGRDKTSQGGEDLAEVRYVKLEVSDTGRGMTQEVLGRIFDPFFTTKFPGRGLGLAVTKGIVRGHGGTIRVSSALGQGTTFEILLPVSAERIRQHEGDAAPAASAHTPSQTRRILVVEDEDALRFAVAKALRKQGFSVIEANDGSTAIATIGAQGQALDAVLLDVTLPGSSSRDVLESARRTYPGLRVILTSAYGRETVDSAFAGLPVEHFIRKPFSLNDLYALLRDIPPQ